MFTKQPMTAVIRNKNETVTISLADYNQLVEDQRFLDALVAAGVDNWDGYQFAQEALDSED